MGCFLGALVVLAGLGFVGYMFKTMLDTFDMPLFGGVLPAITALGLTAPAGPTPYPLAASSPAAASVYHVGDAVKNGSLTETVQSFARNSDTVSVNVEIDNGGATSISVSPAGSFLLKDVYGDAFILASQQGSDPMDGSVLPGDKLTGTLVYSVPAGQRGDGLKLYALGRGDAYAVVALDATVAAAPFPVPGEVVSATPFSTGTTYAINQAVVDKDVSVNYTLASVSGNTITAWFVVYNGGQTSLHISDSDSFLAKNGSGASGDASFSSHFSGLDGALVPGDTLRGRFQWTFSAPAQEARVYFTDQALGADVLAWAVR